MAEGKCRRDSNCLFEASAFRRRHDPAESLMLWRIVCGAPPPLRRASRTRTPFSRIVPEKVGLDLPVADFRFVGGRGAYPLLDRPGSAHRRGRAAAPFDER